MSIAMIIFLPMSTENRCKTGTFGNEYMSQYSWAEETLGALLFEKNKI